MKKAIICGVLSLTGFQCLADPFVDRTFDAISIRADQAREDERSEIIHFEGNFQMRSSEWQLESARAIVHGSPNKPDRIYLEGAPAQFHVSPSDESGGEQVEAIAPVVEYRRDTRSLLLSGGAMLKLGEEIIRSTYIEYDIDASRYRAGGEDGVLMEVPPIDER